MHHRAHVDLIEGREHGCSVLRVLQAACNRLAQPRHMHALFTGGIVGRRRRAHLHRRSDRRRLRRRALDRAQHVAFGDLSMQAGAADFRRVDAAFRRYLSYRGRHRHFRRPLWSRRRLLRGFCGFCCRRRCFGRSTGPFLDLAKQRADGDGIAVLHGNVRQYARCRSGHLERHLVGLKLDQRLIDRHRIARLLEPFSDGRFRHGFAEGGHADVSHVSPFLSFAMPGHDSQSSTPAPRRGTA